MIAWTALKVILGKHGLVIGLVALLGMQQFQGWRAERRHAQQVEALTASIEGLKTDLAQARGTIQKLSDAAATLKPGETKTIYVDRPVYLPGKETVKEVPVVVTRTEKAVETKVETVTLPGKEIERIVSTAPQSLIFTLTATRDIAKGETFRVVASQVQPGVYQPILELGAPVAAQVTTVTPVDRIPAPPKDASRWSFALLAGVNQATVLTRGEIAYRLSPSSFARAEVEWPWNGQGVSGRLMYGIRF